MTRSDSKRFPVGEKVLLFKGDKYLCISSAFFVGCIYLSHIVFHDIVVGKKGYSTFSVKIGIRYFHFDNFPF